MLAIGLTDPVHNLVTFLGERKKGIDPKLAAEYALAKNLLPSFVCFVTTAVGFGSFLTANIKTISELGLAAAVGCSLAWLFSQLFLGGLLFLIPWKRLPAGAEQHNTRLANFLTSWVDRRRPYVVGVFVVLSLGGAFAGAMNRVDADPVKYFAKGHPLRDATDFIEAGVGASRSLELVVDSGKADGAKSAAFLSRVDKLESWLREQSKITQTLSIVDVLKHTHRALSGGVQTAFALAEDDGTIAQELMLYSMNLPEGLGLNDRLTLEQDALRISVLWTVGSSHEAVAKIRDIENKAQELGLDLTVTGKYPLFQRMEDHLVKSFLSSFFSSIIVVILIMMAFFRSVRVGLFAMVPNVVPLMVGGLVLWLLDERFTIGTMLVSSVCLGIAVDDTSYYLSEYLHLVRLGRTPREAVHEVYEGTGPSIFATTAVLVITFGAFALSTFTPNQVFGIMTAVVLSVAWCTDIVLLPALLLMQRGGKKRVEPALDSEPDPVLASAE
jgi:predicted RND superfamily exporter protein